MRVPQWWLAALLALPVSLLADDFKVIKLEQDVRNLERQVNELKRQLSALQRRDGQAAIVPAATRAPEAPVSETPAWLDARNWDRLRAGMSELEVIQVLGKPTSMRSETSESRTLLYAMEIGTSGFLGGSVQLKNRQVASVSKPVLK